MLKLYDYFRSSASFRVRIALNLKNLEYTREEIHLAHQGGQQHRAEYALVNSQRLVPSLLVEGTVITQSMAIIDYLEDVHPNPSLYPETALNKAHCRSLAQIIACDTHPLNNLRVLKYLQDNLSLDDEVKSNWYKHWAVLGLRDFLAKLEHLKVSGTFCFGDQITLADICLVPQLYNARRFSCNLTGLERLIEIDQQCQAHPAFLNAWPEEVTA